MAIPSGTVTFVFTDIEGSTQRWERDRTAMEGAVRRHDDLIRRVVAVHGGHVFKTIGDAFCCAFAQPAAALAATLDVQRALAAQDFSAVDGLRIRVALHTGTADERDNEYFGPTVNRVARLLAIAHGGQIVVSEVTRELARASSPPAVAFTDLGMHRLKDLSRAEHVYQVVAPGLRAEFPPLRSLAARPTNIPAELTSFIGRDAEVAELVALLTRSRLVTLVGAGGIGKTRISLQVAAKLLEAFEDGVWFVELAPLADGALIAGTVARLLGLTLAADDDPVTALVNALGSRHLLFIFDNCEHLIDEVAAVIATLLRSTLNVSVLASSRQSLQIAGEEVYRVPSLAVPAGELSEPLVASKAAEFGAVALFVERAVAADQRFTLTDQNAPVVAEIVRRLDGIALAIELAASRVKILDVRQLANRLDERFRLLTGGSRDTLPRQQTLRALIDWSYDLLDDREKRVFMCAGVFVGGFVLDAAVAVCSDDGLDEFDLLDMLTSLVDKSLITVEFATDDVTRYSLLESTRAYALEKLAASGERDRLAERHLAWIETMTSRAEIRLAETLRGDALDALGSEIGNIRAALAWARTSGAVESGAAVVGSIAERASRKFGSSAEWFAQVRYFIDALPAERFAARARLSWADCLIAGNSGRFRDSLSAAEKALCCARASGDGLSVVRSCTILAGAMVRSRMHTEARALLAEVEASGLVDSSPLRFVNFYVALGLLENREGNADAAIRCYEKVLARYRALGVPVKEGTIFMNLAELEHSRGNTDRAIQIAREGLAAVTAPFDRSTIACNLAGYLLAIDDVPGARWAAHESFEIYETQRAGSAGGVVPLEHLTLVIALEGDLVRAARLLAYTTARFAEAGFEREHTERLTHDRLRALLASGLPADDLARYEREGAAFTPDVARAQADASAPVVRAT